MFRSRRPVWQVDMGDGTWAAACQSCRTPLGRGPKAKVQRAARGHSCHFATGNSPNPGRPRQRSR